MSDNKFPPRSGNPLVEDPTLKRLLNDITDIPDELQFTRWKEEFLVEFDKYLSQAGTFNVNLAFQEFASRVLDLAKEVRRMEVLRESGDMTADRCTVQARRCLGNFYEKLIRVNGALDRLVPGTNEEEVTAGFTKFNLGAILIRDGFVEYDRLEKIQIHLGRLQKDGLDMIADPLALDAIDSYGDKFDRMCDILADLGLYHAMQKCTTFIKGEWVPAPSPIRKSKSSGDLKELRQALTDSPGPTPPKAPSLDDDDEKSFEIRVFGSDAPEEPARAKSFTEVKISDTNKFEFIVNDEWKTMKGGAIISGNKPKEKAPKLSMVPAKRIQNDDALPPRRTRSMITPNTRRSKSVGSLLRRRMIPVIPPVSPASSSSSRSSTFERPPSPRPDDNAPFDMVPTIQKTASPRRRRGLNTQPPPGDPSPSLQQPTMTLANNAAPQNNTGLVKPMMNLHGQQAPQHNPGLVKPMMNLHGQQGMDDFPKVDPKNVWKPPAMDTAAAKQLNDAFRPPSPLQLENDVDMARVTIPPKDRPIQQMEPQKPTMKLVPNHREDDRRNTQRPTMKLQRRSPPPERGRDSRRGGPASRGKSEPPRREEKAEAPKKAPLLQPPPRERPAVDPRRRPQRSKSMNWRQKAAEDKDAREKQRAPMTRSQSIGRRLTEDQPANGKQDDGPRRSMTPFRRSRTDNPAPQQTRGRSRSTVRPRPEEPTNRPTMRPASNQAAPESRKIEKPSMTLKRDAAPAAQQGKQRPTMKLKKDAAKEEPNKPSGARWMRGRKGPEAQEAAKKNRRNGLGGFFSKTKKEEKPKTKKEEEATADLFSVEDSMPRGRRPAPSRTPSLPIHKAPAKKETNDDGFPRGRRAAPSRTPSLSVQKAPAKKETNDDGFDDISWSQMEDPFASTKKKPSLPQRSSSMPMQPHQPPSSPFSKMPDPFAKDEAPNFVDFDESSSEEDDDDDEGSSSGSGSDDDDDEEGSSSSEEEGEDDDDEEDEDDDDDDDEEEDSSDDDEEGDSSEEEDSSDEEEEDKPKRRTPQTSRRAQPVTRTNNPAPANGARSSPPDGAKNSPPDGAPARGRAPGQAQKAKTLRKKPTGKPDPDGYCPCCGQGWPEKRK
jgi:hypothetical protein